MSKLILFFILGGMCTFFPYFMLRNKVMLGIDIQLNNLSYICYSRPREEVLIKESVKAKKKFIRDRIERKRNRIPYTPKHVMVILNKRMADYHEAERIKAAKLEIERMKAKEEARDEKGISDLRQYNREGF